MRLPVPKIPVSVSGYSVDRVVDLTAWSFGEDVQKGEGVVFSVSMENLIWGGWSYIVEASRS